MPHAKSGAARVKSTSRTKLRSRSERMRRLGMKPVTVWVPDEDSDRFLLEAARQSRLIAEDPATVDDLAFVDSLAEDVLSVIARDEEDDERRPRDDEAR